MQITCLGAARCVTGSSFLIDTGRKYLVDCGLFQGGHRMEALNRGPWGLNPADIEALSLTHAHIDHSGRIPGLVKDGFRGRIYATVPTVELTKILLLDSAHIQEMEAEWQTRKNERRGESLTEPLYRLPDAEACFPLFEPVKQDEILRPDPDLSIRFRNSGHILGSSLLEIFDGPPHSAKKTVFTGDLGHKGQMIVQDPEIVSEADILFIESTYGNRNHKSIEESERELLKAIEYSWGHGEKVLIPAFAVERTQELLFILGRFFRQKLIPPMPVYLDSPLAIAATTIFRNMKQYYDAQTRAALDSGDDPFNFDQLVLTRSALESMEINGHPGPGRRDRGKRDVYGGQNQAPPQAQPVAAGMFAGNSRLSGGGQPGQKHRGRCADGENTWRKGDRAGESLHHRRLIGARGPKWAPRVAWQFQKSEDAGLCDTWRTGRKRRIRKHRETEIRP